LLTDGENHNETPEQLTNAIMGVTGKFQCDCRGVGVDWQVAEVRRIAQALLGSVDIIPEPDQMSQVFSELMQQSMSRGVADAQLRVWAPQGAQVLFQVAGGCGLGTLKAADAAGIWGIGVDKDQYNDAKRVLTSGVKRVDNGVFTATKQVEEGKFKGGGNLLFNLKNKGMDVGKINPAVPKDLIDKMNELKQKIISGQVKVPAAL
jgi:hypothetical protein